MPELSMDPQEVRKRLTEYDKFGRITTREDWKDIIAIRKHYSDKVKEDPTLGNVQICRDAAMLDNSLNASPIKERPE